MQLSSLVVGTGGDQSKPNVLYDMCNIIEIFPSSVISQGEKIFSIALDHVRGMLYAQSANTLTEQVKGVVYSKFSAKFYLSRYDLATRHNTEMKI